MPEFKHYVTQHWNAMLRCVLHGDEHHSRNRTDSNKKETRISTVTQRVLIRMLVTAVQFEAMNIGNRSSGKDKVAPMTHLDDDDIEFLDAQRTALVGSFQQSATATTTTNASKKSTTSNNTKTQEEFTMALLRELPQLLVTFKSETSILQSLTFLPQYFCTFLRIFTVSFHVLSQRNSLLGIVFILRSTECSQPIQSKEGCTSIVVKHINDL